MIHFKWSVKGSWNQCSIYHVCLSLCVIKEKDSSTKGRVSHQKKNKKAPKVVTNGCVRCNGHSLNFLFDRVFFFSLFGDSVLFNLTFFVRVFFFFFQSFGYIENFLFTMLWLIIEICWVFVTNTGHVKVSNISICFDIGLNYSQAINC